ncbi:MAG: chromate transporter [Bacteroidales bacterium]
MLLLQLFYTFFKIGAFTFGGGWAMVSLMEKEIVDKRGWIDRDNFLDYLAVSQSLPGILAVNISVLVGNKLFGKKGAFIASLGTIIPSFVIILLIAIFFTRIYDSPVVERIFKGVRPAVVALIIAPVFSTAKAAKITIKSIWIPIIVAGLITVGISPVIFIILGITSGAAYCYIKSKKLNKL